MARKTMFNFHFERDAWRAGQVRNSNLCKKNIDDAGFIDAADWEEVKKKGPDVIKAWIDNQLIGTSVTVVLVGTETADRKYVNYEIEQSIKRANGLVALFIHNVKDKDGRTDLKGKNPLDNHWVPCKDGKNHKASAVYKNYDWILDDGYTNLGAWVEEAAKKAGK